MIRCNRCGRPVGKGQPKGGDTCTCLACQKGLHQLGKFRVFNARAVELYIREQMRRSKEMSS